MDAQAAHGNADISIVSASRSLSQGDPLSALNTLRQRTDAHALALRGIALAQMTEFDRARELLKQALSQFQKANLSLWSAKIRAALAEVAFAQRDLPAALESLNATELERHEDLHSSMYITIQRARVLALLGRHDDASVLLSGILDHASAPLAHAELLALQGKFGDAARLLESTAASAAASSPKNPLLSGEMSRLHQELRAPRFLFRKGSETNALSLIEIENLPHAYLDTIRSRFGSLDLRRRANQLELLLALNAGPVTSESLFGRSDESLESRLRMEISRLRNDTGLQIAMTPEGYRSQSFGVLFAHFSSTSLNAPVAASLSPTLDPVLAVLSDGSEWPPRSIALLLGQSVRTVERRLENSTEVEALGKSRARRYRLKNPSIPFATQLLLASRSPVPLERSTEEKTWRLK